MKKTILFIAALGAVLIITYQYTPQIEKRDAVTLSASSKAIVEQINKGVSNHIDSVEFIQNSTPPLNVLDDSLMGSNPSKNNNGFVVDCDHKEFIDVRSMRNLDSGFRVILAQRIGQYSTSEIESEKVSSSEYFDALKNPETKITSIISYMKTQIEAQNNLAKEILSRLPPESPDSYYIAQNLATHLIELAVPDNFMINCMLEDSETCHILKEAVKDSIDPFMNIFANNISQKEDIYFINTVKSPELIGTGMVCASDIKSARLVMQHKFSQEYKKKLLENSKDMKKSPFMS